MHIKTPGRGVSLLPLLPSVCKYTDVYVYVCICTNTRCLFAPGPAPRKAIDDLLLTTYYYSL